MSAADTLPQNPIASEDVLIVLAQRDVVITLRDEAANPVQQWKLRNVVPMKYTGPSLAGKGGGEVAMEELVLSAERYEIAPAS